MGRLRAVWTAGAAALCVLLLLCASTVQTSAAQEQGEPGCSPMRLESANDPAGDPGPEDADNTETETEISPGPVRERLRLTEDIVHGGGAVGGYICSNTREAAELAFSRGQRIIELDFSLTRDGEPVCLHDWNVSCFPGRTGEEFPLTLAEFESSRIYGALTPMTLPILTEWMSRHKTVRIIIDCKDGLFEVLEPLVERYPELQERFIPQIYAEDQLPRVRGLGFTEIIYTLYRLDWEHKLDAERIAAFAAENELTAITFPVELTENAEYVEMLLTSGVPLYTHTVNGEEAIAAQRAMGITGVYSDYY